MDKRHAELLEHVDTLAQNVVSRSCQQKNKDDFVYHGNYEDEKFLESIPLHEEKKSLYNDTESSSFCLPEPGGSPFIEPGERIIKTRKSFI